LREKHSKAQHSTVTIRHSRPNHPFLAPSSPCTAPHRTHRYIIPCPDSPVSDRGPLFILVVRIRIPIPILSRGIQTRTPAVSDHPHSQGLSAHIQYIHCRSPDEIISTASLLPCLLARLPPLLASLFRRYPNTHSLRRHLPPAFHHPVALC
jgi:hypothetical protein